MVLIGKRNQIYAKYVRIMTSADNPNEIYLVMSKDQPMDKKYIRQFDNMFAGKDVILTIDVLIRNKNEGKDQTPVEDSEAKERRKKKTDEEKDFEDSPFWSVPEE